MGEIESNLDRKTVKNMTADITGYQSRKYDATIRPFKNLSINRNLLALSEVMSAAEFVCLIKLWDWFQSTEIKNNNFKFMMSRSKLAEVTKSSEWVAQATLATLKRVNALLSINTSFGVSEYVWNINFLYRGVYEIHTAPVCKPYGPCVEFIRPLSANHTASIICTLIIPLYLPSYTSLSGHKKIVDNSTSIGELKGALRAGFPLETLKDALRAGLPVRNLVALGDAILNSWISADRGGSFWLHDIMIILQTFQVDLYESKNVTGVLYSILKNGENLHNARKKIAHYFSDDESLFEHYLKLKEVTSGDV